MVKIFSPFSGDGNGLGNAIAGLGKQLFGDKTGNMLNSEKLYEAQRTNQETDNLMKRVSGNGGAQSLGGDPLAQAMMIGSGYDPGKFADMGLMGAATTFGASDPRTNNWQVGSGQGYDNTSAAFQSRLAETKRANDIASSDRRYGVDQGIGQQMYEFGNVSAKDQAYLGETTRNNDIQSADRRYGVDASVGQQQNEFQNKPMAAMGPNGPTFAPQGELASGGFAPVLSETDQKGVLLGQNWQGLDTLNPNQQAVLGATPDGAKSKTPRNYRGPDGNNYITYDGVSNATTGAPLPGGGYLASVDGSAQEAGLTNSTLSGLQQQDFANSKFHNLLGKAKELAAQDPTNFGIPGLIKGASSDVVQLANGLATGMGYPDAAQAIQDVRKSALQSGVNPTLLSGIFDPTKAGLETVSDLLVYAAAESLAGQAGRSVSDKDVQFFKSIVGDPRGLTMSQEKYMAKLDEIQNILDLNSGTVRSYLQNGVAAGTNNAAPLPSVQPQPAPSGPPQPGSVEDGFVFKGGDPADPANWQQVR